MSITLYSHQQEALGRIHNGCILCGGVGSGKSRTSLAYYYLENGGSPESLIGYDYYPMSDPPKDLYIITTARKRDTLEWEKELIPFLLSTDKETNLYSNKVIIDSWNNIKKYIDVRDAFFIFDEQRVVGYGEWTKSFLKITKANQWILLSATPGDTWMDYIPVFIANGFYKNKTEFIREHVIWKPYSKFPSVDRYVNTRHLVRLRDSILVDMEFERPTESHNFDIKCEYDVAKYKEIVKTRFNPYTSEPIQNASEFCYTLRKVVNSDKSRIEKVLDIFKERKKIIVFYNFDYELEILKSAEYGDGVVVAEWNGHRHQEIPTGDRWIYLVQYTAGAEGWNCITTNSIVFYSQNYSYKVLIQAMGRIDRLNTPYKDLYYYHLKSSATIDIMIGRALKDKKRFNEGRFAQKILES